MSTHNTARGSRLVVVLAASAVVALATLWWMQQAAYRQTAKAGGPRQLALSAELGKSLGPEYSTLPPRDLNGDQDPDYLGYVPMDLPKGDSLRVRAFAIAALPKGKPRLLLELTREGQILSMGKPVVPTAGTHTGYWVEFGPDQRALTITLVDAQGQPVSDGLSLVWDSTANRYQPH